MPKPTPNARKDKNGLSRQRRWQLKKAAEGKCITCGGDKAGSNLQKCFRCQDAQNKSWRERKGKKK